MFRERLMGESGMSPSEILPELREILGSLIFGADRPLSVNELRRCLIEVAETQGGEADAFGKVRETDVAAALAELAVEIAKARCGFSLAEVAGGFRFESDPACGKWLRHLLRFGKPSRLSHPALETLAIIAYRQPISRSQIESIRGVNVDHIVRLLLEMQLVRIVGRSELPGRPFLYGSTQTFLEHFGLRNLNELNDIEPMMLASGVLGRTRGGARAAGPAAGEPPEAAPAQPTPPASADAAVAPAGAAQGEGDPTAP